MKKVKIIALGFAIFFTGISSVFAQDGNGRIEGTVYDATTGETLVGVNVMVDGTSLGDASSLEGTYLIRNVPAGTRTVIVSYIGYQRIEEEVEVVDGETLELDFELSAETVVGEEITISSQAEGQRSAINEQISSRSIKNVVSAEKIRELPDASAATALSRLPGVSLQGGDRVVLRGIQAKMNTILVNGVQLPSTTMNDRSTNLGFISSNMLAGIDVTKAVTPDMDANSIGGVVNLRLQEAPEDFHFDIMAQGAYNTMDETADNYQVWGSVSNRFFDNKLGAFFQLNANRSNGGQDIARANYGIQTPTAEVPPYGEGVYAMNAFIYEDQVRINSERGGSLILDYKLPNGKIALQNTFADTENDFIGFKDQLDFEDVNRTFEFDRDLSSKVLLVNALQVENDFDFMKVNFGISRAYSEKDTDIRYGHNDGPTADFEFDNGVLVPFEGDFSVSKRLELTHQDVYDLELSSDYANSIITAGGGGTTSQDFDQTQTASTLNITIPVDVNSNISGEFKTGGVYKISTRNNNKDRTTVRLAEAPTQSNRLAADWMREQGINPGNPPTYSDYRDYDYGDGRGSNFLNGRYVMDMVIDKDLFDTWIRLASPAWSTHFSHSKQDDYSGDETLTAFYGMFDFNFWNKVQLLGGLRYENHHSEYDANMVLVQHAVDGIARIPNEEYDTPEVQRVADSLTTSDRTVAHLFPNLQLQYKINDKMDIRLAYTKTLSRPDYNAIVPRINFASTDRGNAGNPNLEPSVSDNLDAYFSIYTNQIGLLTAGVFYKRIEDMFYGESRLFENLDESIIYPTNDEIARINYQATTPKASIQTYFNNPNPAYLRGIELEWQTHFWYLPKPLSNIVLNVNYTRTFSEMDYAQTNYTTELDCSGRICLPVAVPFDTARTARLVQQGNHLVNLAVGYDYKGFSGRVSYRMQGNVITNVANRPEQDSFTGNNHTWDLTIRQKLPVPGLKLFINAMNLNYLPNKAYRKFKRDPDGPVLTNLVRTSFNARRFQVGLRYSY